METNLKRLASDMFYLQRNETNLDGHASRITRFDNKSEVSVFSSKIKVKGWRKLPVQGSIMQVFNAKLNSSSLKAFIHKDYVFKESNRRSTTFPMPDTPFLSIFALRPNSMETLSLNISFTYPMSTSLLDEKVQEILDENQLGRVLLTDLQLKCSFLNMNKSIFEQTGCSSERSSHSTNITCHCNHTTMFAVLLTATTVIIPYGVQVNLKFYQYR